MPDKAKYQRQLLSHAAGVGAGLVVGVITNIKYIYQRRNLFFGCFFCPRIKTDQIITGKKGRINRFSFSVIDRHPVIHSFLMNFNAIDRDTPVKWDNAGDRTHEGRFATAIFAFEPIQVMS